MWHYVDRSRSTFFPFERQVANTLAALLCYVEINDSGKISHIF